MGRGAGAMVRSCIAGYGGEFAADAEQADREQADPWGEVPCALFMEQFVMLQLL